MANPVPQLGFICPRCNCGMQPICPVCTDRDAEEMDAKLNAEYVADQEAQTQLSIEHEPLGKKIIDQLGISVKVEVDQDEDGEEVWTLSVEDRLLSDVSVGAQTREAAVEKLRQQLSVVLHDMHLCMEELGADQAK